MISWNKEGNDLAPKQGLKPKMTLNQQNSPVTNGQTFELNDHPPEE